MDRFKQIETFVRVADAGSLAAAALEEGVSPVVLGRRIDALEKRLGVKLMYRRPRSAASTSRRTHPVSSPTSRKCSCRST
jgi:DNA-binding transcriptional LysR family regulator